MASLGCVLAGSIILNFFLLMALSMNEGKGGRRGLQEARVSGKGTDKIALIRVNGTITGAPTSYADSAAAPRVIAQLKRARKDKQVKGVFLEINSPGGSVTASDRLYQAMLRFKKSKKPIVVMMGDTCASGCVYMTAPADKIYAHPTTVTGSIGVIISTLNFSKFLEKHGIEGVTIASKENKALLSPFAPVKEEHKKILKDIVDEMYQRFVGIVSKWRKIPKDKLLGYADGRIFSAKRAKEYKLIDAIGYRQKALKDLYKLAKVTNPRLVRYQRNVNLMDILQGYAKVPAMLKQAQRPPLEKLLHQTPKVYYLWSHSPKR